MFVGIETLIKTECFCVRVDYFVSNCMYAKIHYASRRKDQIIVCSLHNMMPNAGRNLFNGNFGRFTYEELGDCLVNSKHQL